uniref:Mitochondrial fission process protein 1 n=1 Tax=Strigamia maritima TaxID=126957 RepID=T1JDA1_STRMM
MTSPWLNLSVLRKSRCEEAKLNPQNGQNVVKQVDIYRDTPVRLLGYSNEVGESFRHLIPLWLVRGTYVVAFGYVFADTADKAKKANQIKYESESIRSYQLKKTIADTLIWQSFASVIIPGFTINRTCAITLSVLNRAARVSQGTRNWVAVAVCLSLIPIIVHPIDSFVDFVLDRSLRKYF